MKLAQPIIEWIEPEGGKVEVATGKYPEIVLSYSVSFKDTGVTDSQLKCLNGLSRQLEHLDLDGTSVTGPGISGITIGNDEL